VKAVVVPAALLNEMRAHSRESYPDECCGFLLATSPEPEKEGRRTICALERARNEYEGERRRRFLIRPEELREVERRAESSGRAVVGFYHSHPDHPARPSQFDQDHAWPWYTYLILGVTATDVPSVKAFELDPDSLTFHEAGFGIAEDPTLVPTVATG
jgi:proteasome lid subunit RPN8/RPN11